MKLYLFLNKVCLLIRKKVIKLNDFFRVIFFSLILIFSYSTIQLSSAQDEYYTPEDLFTEEFEEKVIEKMGIAKAPSSSIGIIHEDEIVYLNALGEQTHINTSFHMGSLPKTLLATSVLQLYEDGLFDLHDPINEYLPYKIENWKSPDVNITIYHLLTHKSGLLMTDDYGWNIWYDTITFPDYLYEFLHVNGSEYSPDYFFTEVGNLYEYENVNYNLLAFLVELISGESYEEYLNNNIFHPFGVDNSGFNHEDYPDELLAKVYYIDDNGDVVEDDPYTVMACGAGGLISAGIDMTYFMGAHMNNGEFNGVRILNETSVELMHSPQASNDEGFAWSLSRPNIISDPRIEGFGGIGYGARSYMHYSPAKKVGVLLLMNMYDQAYIAKLDNVFKYIFNKALKLNDINTEKTNSISTILILGSLVSLVIVLQKRKKV
jgi:CubicO group peptidase (beta-lactamase class C family)